MFKLFVTFDPNQTEINDNIGQTNRSKINVNNKDCPEVKRNKG